MSRGFSRGLVHMKDTSVADLMLTMAEDRMERLTVELVSANNVRIALAHFTTGQAMESLPDAGRHLTTIVKTPFTTYKKHKFAKEKKDGGAIIIPKDRGNGGDPTKGETEKED
jgi:hypothetical protein